MCVLISRLDRFPLFDMLDESYQTIITSLPDWRLFSLIYFFLFRLVFSFSWSFSSRHTHREGNDMLYEKEATVEGCGRQDPFSWLSTPV